MDRYKWDGDLKVIMKAAMLTGHKALWSWLAQPENAGKKKEDWPGIVYWQTFVDNILNDPTLSLELKRELKNNGDYIFNADTCECFACMMGYTTDYDTTSGSPRCGKDCVLEWPNDFHCNTTNSYVFGSPGGLFNKWCRSGGDLEKRAAIANQIANLPVRGYLTETVPDEDDGCCCNCEPCVDCVGYKGGETSE